MPTPPPHEALEMALAHDLGEEVTCDALTGDFVLFQRRRGHRHSTDDLLTAWYAATELPAVLDEACQDGAPLRLLDLGTGIGSVGLALLWFARQRAPGTHLVGVEAQEVSFRILQQNIAANGVADEVTPLHADLRDASAYEAAGSEAFHLVTGSPPYFDVKAGIVSRDSQRAHARFELRGDVRDYALAAARRLAPGGRFVLCFPTVQRRRAEAACEAAGLVQVRSRDVIPRAGIAPLFTLFVYARAPREAPPILEPPFVVREADGAHTPMLMRAQACFELARARPPKKKAERREAFDVRAEAERSLRSETHSGVDVPDEGRVRVAGRDEPT